MDEWLARHPEQAADWDADALLSRAVRRLPSVAVPSNFNARVLSAIEAETRRGRGPSWLRLPWRPLVPRLAMAGILAAGLAGWQLHEHQQREAEYARHVAQLRAIAELPPVVLEDFEAIQRFGDSSPPVDYELLAAFQ